MFVSR